MKRLMIFILAAFVSCGTFAQTSQPASKTSVEQLLEMTETRQLHEATMQEVTKMVDESTARIMNRIPPEKQDKFKKVMLQLDTIIKEEMIWDNMKDQYIQIYMETFTQQEIDDLVAFYKTPSGRSFIKKQPLVIQRTLAISQEKMGIMLERSSNIMQKVMTE
jgi:hypothetical protein